MGSYPELKGKAAIVTGATAGIGKATALCLAEEGANVIAVGRNDVRGKAVERTLRELGTESSFVRCDVVSAEEVEATCREAERRLGKVDILINCAGGFPGPVKVTDYSVEDWDYLVNSNLRSAFLFTRLVLPGMIERKWGRIVNISSASAQATPSITSAIYSAAKAGMLGFTRHVAAEVAPYGVTVNATAPGFTLTERVYGVLTPELLADRNSKTPMGRPSEPIEQAGAVVFLCSDRAGYITGVTVNVSGGIVMP